MGEQQTASNAPEPTWHWWPLFIGGVLAPMLAVGALIVGVLAWVVHS